jgi:hypothetical protein
VSLDTDSQDFAPLPYLLMYVKVGSPELAIRGILTLQAVIPSETLISFETKTSGWYCNDFVPITTATLLFPQQKDHDQTTKCLRRIKTGPQSENAKL